MELTIDAIISGIDRMEVEFYKNPHSEDVKEKQAKNILKMLPNDATKVEFKKVIEYIIDNADNIEKYPTASQIYYFYREFGRESSDSVHACNKCGNGLRRYRVKLKIFDIEKGKRVWKWLTCHAACSCPAGEKRHKEEDFLYYDDVIERNNTVEFDPVKDKSSQKQMSEIIEKTAEDMGADTKVEEIDHEEELPF